MIPNKRIKPEPASTVSTTSTSTTTTDLELYSDERQVLQYTCNFQLFVCVIKTVLIYLKFRYVLLKMTTNLLNVLIFFNTSTSNL